MATEQIDALIAELRDVQARTSYAYDAPEQLRTLLDRVIVALRGSAQDRAARAQTREIHQPTNREDAEAGNVNAIRHVAYGEGYRDGKVAARAQGAGEAVAPEVLKAAHNACKHFYEFNETPEALAASEFGRSMDVLEEAVGRVRDAALQSLVDDAQDMGLYDSPTIPQAAEVPGFVLVPREPTQEMLLAAVECPGREGMRSVYRAMLAAAPTPTASAPKACPHGDRFCPCPDGDTCHYEGANPSPAPKAEGEAERAWTYRLNVLESCANWLESRSRCITLNIKADPVEGGGYESLMRRYAEDLRAIRAVLAQPPSEADRTREGGDVVAAAREVIRTWYEDVPLSDAADSIRLLERAIWIFGTTTSEGGDGKEQQK